MWDEVRRSKGTNPHLVRLAIEYDNRVVCIRTRALGEELALVLDGSNIGSRRENRQNGEMAARVVGRGLGAYLEGRRIRYSELGFSRDQLTSKSAGSASRTTRGMSDGLKSKSSSVPGISSWVVQT